VRRRVQTCVVRSRTDTPEHDKRTAFVRPKYRAARPGHHGYAG
jgi:hypothetical protein